MDTQNALSPIIVFRNEGDNVRKTLESIKETATGLLYTLLVDDASDDGYDYESLAQEYGADYHRMDEPSGSVGTKDYGATHCKSEYFVILDGHMKFFHKGWDEKLLAIMKDHKESIITSRTVIMTPDTNNGWRICDKDDPEHNGSHWGAYVCWKPALEFESKWTNIPIPHEDKRVNKVASVLGAVYASNKQWWQKIEGLKGLNKYGLEETFMSIKTWLMGGECLIVKDWGVGHLYRTSEERPKGISALESDYEANRLFLAAFFRPQFAFHYADNLRKHYNQLMFSIAYGTFLKTMRDTSFGFHSKAKHDFSYFEEINQLAQKKE